MPATISAKKKVLPDALYIGDNGAMFCGNCAGASAAYTLRDISGQRIYRVKHADAVALMADGVPCACEGCRKAFTV